MAAWSDTKDVQATPLLLKRKPKLHLRNLADDLRMLARDAAKKGA